MPELQPDSGRRLYCKHCADEIMAKALKPRSGGRRKRVHRPGPAIVSVVQPPLIW